MGKSGKNLLRTRPLCTAGTKAANTLAPMVRQAVAKLWEQILSAQARYTEAMEQINELKTQLSRFETWEAEKKRYQMKDFGGGTLAYDLKPSEAGDEPSHRICPNCYQDGHKSILQNTGISAFKQQMAVCHRCKTEFKFGIRQDLMPPRGRGDWGSR